MTPEWSSEDGCEASEQFSTARAAKKDEDLRVTKEFRKLSQELEAKAQILNPGTQDPPRDGIRRIFC